MWANELNQMKVHTEPRGHRFIDQIIDSLKYYDKAYSTHDLHHLSSLYRDSAQLFKAAIPYMVNAKLAKTSLDVADACELLADEVDNGADLDVAIKFVAILAHGLLGAMA